MRSFIGSLAVAGAALALALVVARSLDAHNVSRVFLVGVLVSAIAYGLWPAVFASLISAIAYDYFFLPPVYTLSIATNEGIIDFACFLLVAVIVSSLAARVRRHALAAGARAVTAETLSDFAQCLAEPSSFQDVLQQAAVQISALLGSPVTLVLMEGDVPCVNAACPPHIVPDSDCLRKAVAWRALSPADERGHPFKAGDWHFQTLRGAGEALGLLATRPQANSGSARAIRDTLLAALAHQTGMAIDRCKLRERLEQSRLQVETEQLRSNVLTSISHDLCNPLASITASASVLECRWGSLSDTSKLLMARTIRDEAERLSDFIGKLLDLTSVESRTIKPHCQSVLVLDVVEGAVEQAASICGAHHVATNIPDDLPPVRSDAVLLQQVLYNVIENATKYSPPGSLIDIVAREDGGSVVVSVLDEGAGIPDDDLERVFDRFYRVGDAQQDVIGTGLGLAICRGFLKVMHGTIEAANRNDRTGAAFRISLPTATQRQFHEVEQ